MSSAYEENILIVDDDTLVLNSLEKLLRDDHHSVYATTDAQIAWDWIKEKQFAILICDQILPGKISGIDLLKFSLKINPDSIRILITASHDPLIAVDAINIANVSQFIIKPWDNHHLKRMIKTMIEKYRLTKENQEMQNTILESHKELAIAHKSLLQDFELGARIYDALLLGKVPDKVPGFVIKAQTIPSNELDGVFFDFYQPLPYCFDVLIGDVMGKGIPAALIGAIMKTQFIRFTIADPKNTQFFQKGGFWKEHHLNLEEIIRRVHDQIVSQLINLEYFVSLFFGRFDLQKRTLNYSNCGFIKPLHYQAKLNKIVPLKGNNFPLGVVSETNYTSIETPYDKGDFFVFYSDGIDEAKSPNGELFGDERLIKFIEKSSHESPEVILHEITHFLKKFTQKDIFQDDVTMIIVKIVEIHEFATFKQLGPVKFNGDLSQLKVVRNFIQRACQDGLGDIERLTRDLQLAINEIFCNIVKHGYQNQTMGQILIQSLASPEGIEIQISDRGNPFDPSNTPEPNFYGEKENGYGWYLIRQIIEKMEYIPKQTKDGWNHLRLYKHYYIHGEAMEISQKNLDNVLIITLEGDNLDARGAKEFKDKIINFIAENDTLHVVFDLHKLQFIDSSGLGCFLSILRVLNARGGNLKLAEMRKPVRAIFELVSMHKIFEIYHSTDEAVKSFTLNVSS